MQQESISADISNLLLVLSRLQSLFTNLELSFDVFKFEEDVILDAELEAVLFIICVFKDSLDSLVHLHECFALFGKLFLYFIRVDELFLKLRPGALDLYDESCNISNGRQLLTRKVYEASAASEVYDFSEFVSVQLS